MTKVSHVTLRLLRDDGAVVYLNGQEVVRHNMPAGPISGQTLAASSAGPDENEFHEHGLGAAFLVNGRNVVAVEVHQVNGSSSDLGFDLELSAFIAGSGTTLPVVSIGTSDEVASEISILAVIDPARFQISRSGDLSQPLLVFYSIHGSATAGVDYLEVSSSIQIPAGQSSASFDVVPKFDQLEEGMETVVIRIEPSAMMNLSRQ